MSLLLAIGRWLILLDAVTLWLLLLWRVRRLLLSLVRHLIEMKLLTALGLKILSVASDVLCCFISLLSFDATSIDDNALQG